MKKSLIGLLIVLLIALCVYVILNGLTIGKIEILGIQRNKNKQ